MKMKTATQACLEPRKRLLTTVPKRWSRLLSSLPETHDFAQTGFPSFPLSINVRVSSTLNNLQVNIKLVIFVSLEASDGILGNLYFPVTFCHRNLPQLLIFLIIDQFNIFDNCDFWHCSFLPQVCVSESIRSSLSISPFIARIDDFITLFWAQFFKCFHHFSLHLLPFVCLSVCYGCDLVLSASLSSFSVSVALLTPPSLWSHGRQCAVNGLPLIWEQLLLSAVISRFDSWVICCAAESVNTSGIATLGVCSFSTDTHVARDHPMLAF